MLVQDDDVQETVREKNVLNTGSWLQCTALLCQAECAPDAVPGKPGQWPRARFPARNIRNPCSLSWYHGQRARREETLTTGYHGAWQRAPVTRQHLQIWSSTPAARHRPAIIREARYRVASTVWTMPRYIFHVQTFQLTFYWSLQSVSQSPLHLDMTWPERPPVLVF